MPTTLVSPLMQSLRAPKGSHIAPDKLAKRLNMTLGELAALAGVHRNTLGRAPAAPEVQSKLQDIAKILRRATEIGGNEDLAVFWFRHELIPGFDHKTAADLVAAGQASGVMSFLDAVDHGVPS